tara:strand:- start:860 stop:1543 length:684 start_codon:yes stop_codon:yes gene_type:complete
MSIKRRIKTSESDGVEIPLLNKGEYEGRLRYVADLGVHINEHKGVRKADVQKLCLGIEILGETIELEDEVKPRLMWSDAFNIYHQLTEKGKEIVMFRVFDPSAQIGDVADWDAVINEPCNVVVVHKDGTGENAGKVYANIATISPIPSKYKDGVEQGLITDGCTGDVDDPENPAQKATFGLPDWLIQRRIDGGDNAGDNAGDVVDDLRADDNKDKQSREDFDDNIPF